MEPEQPENIAQYHHAHITPVLRDGKLYAELRLVSMPPCPSKILSIGELETLIDDAQRVLTQLRWQYATQYVVTEAASFEHATRHLVSREAVDRGVTPLHTLCGYEISVPYVRWSFSPLVYDIETVYKLCRTCAHIHGAHKKKPPG